MITNNLEDLIKRFNYADKIIASGMSPSIAIEHGKFHTLTFSKLDASEPTLKVVNFDTGHTETVPVKDNESMVFHLLADNMKDPEYAGKLQNSGDMVLVQEMLVQWHTVGIRVLKDRIKSYKPGKFKVKGIQSYAQLFKLFISVAKANKEAEDAK